MKEHMKAQRMTLVISLLLKSPSFYEPESSVMSLERLIADSLQLVHHTINHAITATNMSSGYHCLSRYRATNDHQLK